MSSVTLLDYNVVNVRVVDLQHAVMMWSELKIVSM